MAGERWIQTFEVAQLQDGRMKAIRRDGRTLLMVRVGDEVHAVDGACPHEGYPLVTGDLKDCTLTCSWHNWKFDLRDGSCILGGEGVRRYPTRERGGRVEVDLADPPLEEQVPGLLRSVEHGIVDGDLPRAVRDSIRLLGLGYDPNRLLVDIVGVDARRAEYGSTHVPALAADCADLIARRPDIDPAFAVAPVLDMCIESDRRLPERPPPSRVDAFSEEAFLDAVEREDSAAAEGMVVSALDAGVTRTEVERWMFAAVSTHFTSFGHQLIYLVKLRGLLDRTGGEGMRDAYRALTYSTVLGTREDTLPYMKTYRRYLDEVEPRFAEVHSLRGEGEVDVGAIVAAVLDASPRDALDAVWSALSSGGDPVGVAEALVIAGAHRLHRFDVAIDADPSVAEGWLWATHRFTFASAVRHAVAAFDDPRRMRFLFHAVAFIHSGRKMDRTDDVLPDPSSPDGRSPVDATLDAIRDRRADDAVAAAREALRSGDRDALARGLEDVCLRDPLVRPILVTHAIKTSLAAFDEYDALEGHADREIPVLAAVRFLASPVVERSVRGVVENSLRFVRDGVLPRKLSQ